MCFKHSYMFCNSALASDIIVEVEGVLFHLHKFPLLSKCGKVDDILQGSSDKTGQVFQTELGGCPGGPDAFLVAVKFCYGIRVDPTPRNIASVYAVANYLRMTEDYGEENLLARCESFFHKVILRNWKDCILALKSCEAVLGEADALQIIEKSLSALSMMVCTDISLFGWPMMMYGSLQSPGGSILWNGINTGARIRSAESDWWFEDISYLSIQLFKRLVETMKARGIRPEILAGAVMYYAKKHLPGLVRWRANRGSKHVSAIIGFSPMRAVDQRVLLESIEELLPPKKGKSFCRFLLGLLRVGLILNVSKTCRDSLEKRIGMQLELSTLDGLLLPSYSDSDNLYDTDCVERIFKHFLSSESNLLTPFSPSSIGQEASPSFCSLRRVAKLIDNYLAEVAPDVNLKPEKMRTLAETLPESSRNLHDGLYRALDIYLKAHPWLSEYQREQLCSIINCQKLSIDACAHASQNERLPLRVVLQILFFEQLHLRSAIAGFLHVSDNESSAAAATAANNMASQIVQRDGWVSVVRENRLLKVDMETMGSRIRDLEREFSGIRQEMQRVAKLNSSSRISPHVVSRGIGCKLLPCSSNSQPNVEDVSSCPKQLLETAHPSLPFKHCRSSSLF